MAEMKCPDAESRWQIIDDETGVVMVDDGSAIAPRYEFGKA